MTTGEHTEHSTAQEIRVLGAYGEDFGRLSERPAEVPKAPAENMGLMAVFDLGGRATTKGWEYGKAMFPGQSEDYYGEASADGFKTLLAIDLRDPSGKKWVTGCEIPEGATTAVIDQNGLAVDPDGKVSGGIHFMKPGDSWTYGRNAEVAQQGFLNGLEQATTVSRNHLDFRVSDDGKLIVRDRNSTFGTIYSTGEMARQAVNELGEQHIHRERFQQIIGEEATEQVISEPELHIEAAEPSPVVKDDELPSLVAEPSEVKETSEQDKNNIANALEKIHKIIGENKKGGGSFGEQLRALGGTPEEIMHKLRQTGDARPAVLNSLKTRTTHLYNQFSDEGKRVFLPGVSEDRSKPVNVADSENGEQQLNSLDKVALLALAMLDGTFRYEDDVVKDKADGGNHRDAAEKVLADFAREQIVDTRDIVTESEALKKVFQEAAESFRQDMGRLRNIGTFVAELTNDFESKLRQNRLNPNEFSETIGTALRDIASIKYKNEQLIRNLDLRTREEEESGRMNPSDREKADAIVLSARQVANTLGVITQEGPLVRIKRVVEQLPYDRNTGALLNEIRAYFRKIDDTTQVIQGAIRSLEPYREA